MNRKITVNIILFVLVFIRAGFTQTYAEDVLTIKAPVVEKIEVAQTKQNKKNNDSSNKNPSEISPSPVPTIVPTDSPSLSPTPAPTSPPQVNLDAKPAPIIQDPSVAIPPLIIAFPKEESAPKETPSNNTASVPSNNNAAVIVPLHQPQPSLVPVKPNRTPQNPPHAATASAQIKVFRPPVFSLWNAPSGQYYKSASLPADLTKFLITVSAALLAGGMFLVKFPTPRHIRPQPQNIPMEREKFTYVT